MILNEVKNVIFFIIAMMLVAIMTLMSYLYGLL